MPASRSPATPWAADLAGLASHRLAALADPSKAPAMAAYMKTDMPFYGVQSGTRRQVVRELAARYQPTTQQQYRDGVLALWHLPHREEKYLALDYAVRFRNVARPPMLSLYRRLIVDGAWWDLVDEAAIRLVGHLWLEDRDAIESQMDRWIEHRDLWLRRSAIIGQIKHKAETDVERLFRYCLARAHETEFFIRKAIGWALREHAKTDADAVRSFLEANEANLSGLSYREAAKHLT